MSVAFQVSEIKNLAFGLPPGGQKTQELPTGASADRKPWGERLFMNAEQLVSGAVKRIDYSKERLHAWQRIAGFHVAYMRRTNSDFLSKLLLSHVVLRTQLTYLFSEFFEFCHSLYLTKRVESIMDGCAGAVHTTFQEFICLINNQQCSDPGARGGRARTVRSALKVPGG